MLIPGEEIGRIAKIVVGDKTRERAHRPLECEYETVQCRVFGRLKFLVRYLRCSNPIHFFQNGCDRLFRCLRLGAPGNQKDTGMIVSCVPGSADRVGVSEPAPNFPKESAAKSPSQHVSRHRNRRQVFTVELAAEMSNFEERLRDVSFLHYENSRIRLGIHRWEGGYLFLRHLPRAEDPLQLLLHIGGLKITVESKDDVSREVVALIESADVVATNSIDGSVALLSAVGGIRAIEYAQDLTAGNALRVIIAE